TNIWVADNGTNRLSRINPTTGATSNGYNTPELGPMGLAFDGKDLWVIHNDSGSLTKVNPTTGVFGPVVTIGSQPTAVVFDGTNIWTANNGAGTVSKIIPF
ncbi:MAG: hypothetical protein JWN99_3102, partial [Ilumatobacteraceae bacterium]|nr:hypothetical protein [Ilumatobacteraceae bacterium]